MTATWEPYTNVVFAAGETNIAVRVDSAQLDAYAVSNMCFFAFINSCESDEDGILDWDERFNRKTDLDDPDSDGNGMPDGWKLVLEEAAPDGRRCGKDARRTTGCLRRDLRARMCGGVCPARRRR